MPATSLEPDATDDSGADWSLSLTSDEDLPARTHPQPNRTREAVRLGLLAQIHKNASAAGTSRTSNTSISCQSEEVQPAIAHVTDFRKWAMLRFGHPEAAFRALCGSNTGGLSSFEFCDALSHFGYSCTFPGKLFQYLDMNGHGLLDMKSFIQRLEDGRLHLAALPMAAPADPPSSHESTMVLPNLIAHAEVRGSSNYSSGKSDAQCTHLVDTDVNPDSDIEHMRSECEALHCHCEHLGLEAQHLELQCQAQLKDKMKVGFSHVVPELGVVVDVARNLLWHQGQQDQAYTFCATSPPGEQRQPECDRQLPADSRLDSTQVQLEYQLQKAQRSERSLEAALCAELKELHELAAKTGSERGVEEAAYRMEQLAIVQQEGVVNEFCNQELSMSHNSQILQQEASHAAQEALQALGPSSSEFVKLCFSDSERHDTSSGMQELWDVHRVMARCWHRTRNCDAEVRSELREHNLALGDAEAAHMTQERRSRSLRSELAALHQASTRAKEIAVGVIDGASESAKVLRTEINAGEKRERHLAALSAEGESIQQHLHSCTQAVLEQCSEIDAQVADLESEMSLQESSHATLRDELISGHLGAEEAQTTRAITAQAEAAQGKMIQEQRHYSEAYIQLRQCTAELTHGCNMAHRLLQFEQVKAMQCAKEENVAETRLEDAMRRAKQESCLHSWEYTDKLDNLRSRNRKAIGEVEEDLLALRTAKEESICSEESTQTSLHEVCSYLKRSTPQDVDRLLAEHRMKLQHLHENSSSQMALHLHYKTDLQEMRDTASVWEEAQAQYVLNRQQQQSKCEERVRLQVLSTHSDLSELALSESSTRKEMRSLRMRSELCDEEEAASQKLAEAAAGNAEIAQVRAAIREMREMMAATSRCIAAEASELHSEQRASTIESEGLLSGFQSELAALESCRAVCMAKPQHRLHTLEQQASGGLRNLQVAQARRLGKAGMKGDSAILLRLSGTLGATQEIDLLHAAESEGEQAAMKAVLQAAEHEASQWQTLQQAVQQEQIAEATIQTECSHLECLLSEAIQNRDFATLQGQYELQSTSVRIDALEGEVQSEAARSDILSAEINTIQAALLQSVDAAHGSAAELESTLAASHAHRAKQLQELEGQRDIHDKTKSAYQEALEQARSTHGQCRVEFSKVRLLSEAVAACKEQSEEHAERIVALRGEEHSAQNAFEAELGVVCAAVRNLTERIATESYIVSKHVKQEVREGNQEEEARHQIWAAEVSMAQQTTKHLADTAEMHREAHAKSAEQLLINEELQRQLAKVKTEHQHVEHLMHQLETDSEKRIADSEMLWHSRLSNLRAESDEQQQQISMTLAALSQQQHMLQTETQQYEAQQLHSAASIDDIASAIKMHQIEYLEDVQLLKEETSMTQRNEQRELSVFTNEISAAIAAAVHQACSEEVRQMEAREESALAIASQTLASAENRESKERDVALQAISHEENVHASEELHMKLFNEELASEAALEKQAAQARSAAMEIGHSALEATCRLEGQASRELGELRKHLAHVKCTSQQQLRDMWVERENEQQVARAELQQQIAAATHEEGIWRDEAHAAKEALGNIIDPAAVRQIENDRREVQDLRAAVEHLQICSSQAEASCREASEAAAEELAGLESALASLCTQELSASDSIQQLQAKCNHELATLRQEVAGFAEQECELAEKIFLSHHSLAGSKAKAEREHLTMDAKRSAAKKTAEACHALSVATSEQIRAGLRLTHADLVERVEQQASHTESSRDIVIDLRTNMNEDLLNLSTLQMWRQCRDSIHVLKEVMLTRAVTIQQAETAASQRLIDVSTELCVAQSELVDRRQQGLVDQDISTKEFERELNTQAEMGTEIHSLLTMELRDALGCLAEEEAAVRACQLAWTAEHSVSEQFIESEWQELHMQISKQRTLLVEEINTMEVRCTRALELAHSADIHEEQLETNACGACVSLGDIFSIQLEKQELARQRAEKSEQEGRIKAEELETHIAEVQATLLEQRKLHVETLNLAESTRAQDELHHGALTNEVLQMYGTVTDLQRRHSIAMEALGHVQRSMLEIRQANEDCLTGCYSLGDQRADSVTLMDYALHGT